MLHALSLSSHCFNFVRNRCFLSVTETLHFFVLFLLNSQFTIPFKRDQKQGIDYLALAAESKTVSKKLNIRRSVERLKTKLPRSITRLPIYDREQILAEIDSELPDGVIDQSTDKLQYLNQLIDDTDPILLMPPESEVYLIKKSFWVISSKRNFKVLFVKKKVRKFSSELDTSGKERRLAEYWLKFNVSQSTSLKSVPSKEAKITKW